MTPVQISTQSILSLVFLSFISASPAFAQTGFYIHGGVNSTTAEQSVSRNTGTNEPTIGPAGGPSISVTDQDTAASVYIAGGYEYRPLPDFFAALELYYADERADTVTLNNVKVTDLQLDTSYGVDLKFGHDVTDKFSIYGLVGVAQYEFDGQVSYTFADPIDDISNEEVAFVYGAGVEVKLTDQVSTLAEFRLTNDFEFDTPVDRGGILSDDELELTTIRAGLKYRF